MAATQRSKQINARFLRGIKLLDQICSDYILKKSHAEIFKGQSDVVGEKMVTFESFNETDLGRTQVVDIDFTVSCPPSRAYIVALITARNTNRNMLKTVKLLLVNQAGAPGPLTTFSLGWTGCVFPVSFASRPYLSHGTAHAGEPPATTSPGFHSADSIMDRVVGGMSLKIQMKHKTCGESLKTLFWG